MSLNAHWGGRESIADLIDIQISEPMFI